MFTLGCFIEFYIMRRLNTALGGKTPSEFYFATLRFDSTGSLTDRIQVIGPRVRVQTNGTRFFSQENVQQLEALQRVLPMRSQVSSQIEQGLRVQDPQSTQQRHGDRDRQQRPPLQSPGL